MRREKGRGGNALRTLNVAILVVLAGGILSARETLAQNSAAREATWVTDSNVYAITTSNGITYIGGDFTYIGPNTGYGAPIDAGTGIPQTAFQKVNGMVRACVSDGAGGWYIGGDFTRVGELPRNRIAHILPDGTVNPDWAPNANGYVYALAVSGSTIYAGGEFNNIGGQTRYRIAALDAATGNATAWDTYSNGNVHTLAISGSTLYVGGEFSNIGGQARNRIAAFDTSTGNLTAWNPNAGSTVRALAISGSTVYAGGEFIIIGGQARNRIAALDATLDTNNVMAWNPNANANVYALAVSGSTVYAGGAFWRIGGLTRNYIAAIDAATGIPTGWNPDASGGVNALALDGSTVYVGGYFTSIGGQARNYIAALDATLDTDNATAWNPNVSKYVRALAVSGSTVYAGGEFISIGGLRRNYIAALDSATGIPTAWNPTAGDSVYALATSGSTVYAGGRFTTIGGQDRNRIAALDAATGNTTTWNPNCNGYVLALAVSGSTLYVGGEFSNIGGQARNHLAALDTTLDTNNATAWNPNPGSLVRALAVDGSTVYVGGDFFTMGGYTCNYIAPIDAATGNVGAWSGAANQAVYALAISNSTLYVGGVFTYIGGQARNRIAALDASTGIATAWNPNADTITRALAISGSTLYVGGGFSNIGGQARNRLAALDTTLDSNNAMPWNPNTGNYVHDYALAVSGSTVYAGGSFTTIGDNPRSCFAQFDSGLAPASPTHGGAKDIETNAIIWTWQDNANDETNFKIYADPGIWGPITLQTTTDADVQEWRYDGLSTNTAHAFTVVAINAEGASNEMAGWTTWTLAAVPVAPIVNNPTTFTLKVAVGTGDGNPAYTEYALYNETLGQWVQKDGSLDALPVWQTTAAWDIITVTGLSGATEYAFTVRARNGSHVETANGPSAMGSTDVVSLCYMSDANGSILGDSPQIIPRGGNGTAVMPVPNTGYHFVQWSDSLTSNPRMDTNATSDVYVTAEFAINTYTLTYTAGANGSLIGLSPQIVEHGSDGSAIEALANENYHFAKWSDGSTQNPRTDTSVTSNVCVIAEFSINTYTLNYTAGTGGSIQGITPQTVDHGTSGTEVTAVSDIGYHFVQWSDGLTSNPRTDTNITTDTSLTANFAINQYTVTFQTDGTAGATLDGITTQTVTHGEDCTSITANAPATFHFSHWEISSIDVGSTNPLFVTNVTDSTTYTAVFRINFYTLTYTPGTGGSILGISPQTVDHGTSGTPVIAAPWTGYHFLQWSDSLTSNPRLDTNVTSSLTVTANFGPNIYTVTFEAQGGTIPNETNKQIVFNQAYGPLPTTSRANYIFAGWFTAPTGGSKITETTPATTAEDHTLYARWTLITYSLTYTAGTGGAINGTNTQTVGHGTDGTPVTATPNTGYYFVRWSDGSTENPRTDCNVTENILAEAEFALTKHAVIFQTDGTPSATLSGELLQIVEYGRDCASVIAHPPKSLIFTHWSCLGQTLSIENPLILTNITADMVITAHFGVPSEAIAWEQYE